MPENAFAIAATVGVVLAGPALFCVLIGKNPLPSTSADTQVAAQPVLPPLYVPATPAPTVVPAPAEEAQPIQVVAAGSANEAQPVQVVDTKSDDETNAVQVVGMESDDETNRVQVEDAEPAGEGQPVQVVDGKSLLKRSPFDDFEVRIPINDEEPAPAPKRSASKPSYVAQRAAPAPMRASSSWPTNVRSPWNSVMAGASAYRPGMSSSAFGASRFSLSGTSGNAQRINPFTARFTRANQRTFYRKWYE